MNWWQSPLRRFARHGNQLEFHLLRIPHSALRTKMRFLAPMAFWFAATIPVVILFYLLKRKRVVRLVSSTLLWQKFLAETQASAPFQRLRHNWLLILQLLLLALAILAIARPYLASDAKPSRLRVLILDASASMQSIDETPSRFEKARAEALRWADGLRDNDQMVILQAAAHTEVKQSPTSEKAALRRALQACAVTDGPTRLNEAFKLAETLIRDKADAEIHLFSDGALPNLAEFENKNLPLVYHRFGQRRNNLGILSLDVRAHPEDPRRRAIFTSVVNYSPAPQETTVELLFDGQMIEAKKLTLTTNETAPLVFVAAQQKDGVFTVHLTANDDLAADNQASVVSLLPQPVKVLLVSRGNRFLEKALKSVASVQLSTATDLTESAPAFDVVVLDDVATARWPSRNVLAVHVATTNLFESWTKIQTPPIVDWKNTHPLLRFVNFDDVRIGESLGVKTPAWAVPLVESPKTPLILAGESGRQRIIWIGFDSLQSTWPLRISFPIFIANAVDWLNPASASASQLMVHAGDPFRLRLEQLVSGAEITRPDGVVRPLNLDTNASEIVFGETDKAGTYRLKFGTNDLVFCVNAINPAESDTLPRTELPIGRYGKVTATTARRANFELWHWLAIAGLIVLLGEWWYYHRRTA
jgi:Ca-activated chloride channel family protein